MVRVTFAGALNRMFMYQIKLELNSQILTKV